MDDMDAMVRKHENDLYRGNGKPGLTTRMALTEERVEKIEAQFFQIKWMFVGIFLTVIGDLVVHFLTGAK